MVTDYYATTTGYLTRERGHQNTDQRHQTFSNLILHGKFCEAVNFVCEQQMCAVLLPYQLASDKLLPTEKNVFKVLAGKHPHKKSLQCLRWKPMLKGYAHSIYVTDNLVKLVTRKRLVSLVPWGMDSEALQGWVLKFGEDLKNLYEL